MSTPYLGQLMVVSFGFAPKGWAIASGQLLPINQNQALFSLLGTTFGGNGQTTFALPNLNGRAAMSFGQGFTLGQVTGEENHTLTISEMPQHTHAVFATKTTEAAASPAGNAFADVANQPNFNVYKSNGSPGVSMNPAMVSSIGGSQPHVNQSPYLVLVWVIALQGIFPSQN